MLPAYLHEFNQVVEAFREKYPIKNWTPEFVDSLTNDYAFFSARIEDDKLEYGDTIRFLNNEIVRGHSLSSLLSVSDQQEILRKLIVEINDFVLSEESIKNIHTALMSSPIVWPPGFKQEWIGEYRNIPAIGYREPHFVNKEYTPFYNLEFAMPGHLEMFNLEFADVNNTLVEKHILTRVARFHNVFLNQLHPFADGNGRVCRTVIGAIFMKHDVPPVFPKILDDEDQFGYISTIINCEEQNSDVPIVEYLAHGIVEYLKQRL